MVRLLTIVVLGVAATLGRAELPQCTLPPIESLKKAAPTKTVKTKVAAVGWHTHKCAHGHEWSHADSSKGDVAAHTCPICGMQDWTPNERNTRIVDAPAAAAVQLSLPTFGTSNCPNGVCPTTRRGLFGFWR